MPRETWTPSNESSGLPGQDGGGSYSGRDLASIYRELVSRRANNEQGTINQVIGQNNEVPGQRSAIDTSNWQEMDAAGKLVHGLGEFGRSISDPFGFGEKWEQTKQKQKEGKDNFLDYAETGVRFAGSLVPMMIGGLLEDPEKLYEASSGYATSESIDGKVNPNQLTDEQRRANLGYVAIDALSMIPGLGIEGTLAKAGTKAAGATAKAAGKPGMIAAAKSNLREDFPKAASVLDEFKGDAAKLIGSEERNVAEKASKALTGKQSLAIDLGASSVAEGIEEMGQTYLENVRGDMNGSFTNDDGSIKTDNILEAGVWGAIGGGLMTGGAHGLNYLTRTLNKETAERDARFAAEDEAPSFSPDTDAVKAAFTPRAYSASDDIGRISDAQVKDIENKQKNDSRRQSGFNVTGAPAPADIVAGRSAVSSENLASVLNHEIYNAASDESGNSSPANMPAFYDLISYSGMDLNTAVSEWQKMVEVNDKAGMHKFLQDRLIEHRVANDPFQMTMKKNPLNNGTPIVTDVVDVVPFANEGRLSTLLLELANADVDGDLFDFSIANKMYDEKSGRVRTTGPRFIDGMLDNNGNSKYSFAKAGCDLRFEGHQNDGKPFAMDEKTIDSIIQAINSQFNTAEPVLSSDRKISVFNVSTKKYESKTFKKWLQDIGSINDENVRNAQFAQLLSGIHSITNKEFNSTVISAVIEEITNAHRIMELTDLQTALGPEKIREVRDKLNEIKGTDQTIGIGVSYGRNNDGLTVDQIFLGPIGTNTASDPFLTGENPVLSVNFEGEIVAHTQTNPQMRQAARTIFRMHDSLLSRIFYGEETSKEITSWDLIAMSQLDLVSRGVHDSSMFKDARIEKQRNFFNSHSATGVFSITEDFSLDQIRESIPAYNEQITDPYNEAIKRYGLDGLLDMPTGVDSVTTPIEKLEDSNKSIGATLLETFGDLPISRVFKGIDGSDLDFTIADGEDLSTRTINSILSTYGSRPDLLASIRMQLIPADQTSSDAAEMFDEIFIGGWTTYCASEGRLRDGVADVFSDLGDVKAVVDSLDMEHGDAQKLSEALSEDERIKRYNAAAYLVGPDTLNKLGIYGHKAFFDSYYGQQWLKLGRKASKEERLNVAFNMMLAANMIEPVNFALGIIKNGGQNVKAQVLTLNNYLVGRIRNGNQVLSVFDATLVHGLSPQDIKGMTTDQVIDQLKINLSLINEFVSDDMSFDAKEKSILRLCNGATEMHISGVSDTYGSAPDKLSFPLFSWLKAGVDKDLSNAGLSGSLKSASSYIKNIDRDNVEKMANEINSLDAVWGENGYTIEDLKYLAGDGGVEATDEIVEYMTYGALVPDKAAIDKATAARYEQLLAQAAYSLDGSKPQTWMSQMSGGLTGSMSIEDFVRNRQAILGTVFGLIDPKTGKQYQFTITSKARQEDGSVKIQRKVLTHEECWSKYKGGMNDRNVIQFMRDHPNIAALMGEMSLQPTILGGMYSAQFTRSKSLIESLDKAKKRRVTDGAKSNATYTDRVIENKIRNSFIDTPQALATVAYLAAPGFKEGGTQVSAQTNAVQAAVREFKDVITELVNIELNGGMAEGYEIGDITRNIVESYFDDIRRSSIVKTRQDLEYRHSLVAEAAAQRPHAKLRGDIRAEMVSVADGLGINLGDFAIPKVKVQDTKADIFWKCYEKAYPKSRAELVKSAERELTRFSLDPVIAERIAREGVNNAIANQEAGISGGFITVVEKVGGKYVRSSKLESDIKSALEMLGSSHVPGSITFNLDGEINDLVKMLNNGEIKNEQEILERIQFLEKKVYRSIVDTVISDSALMKGLHIDYTGEDQIKATIVAAAKKIANDIMNDPTLKQADIAAYASRNKGNMDVLKDSSLFSGDESAYDTLSIYAMQSALAQCTSASSPASIGIAGNEFKQAGGLLQAASFLSAGSVATINNATGFTNAEEFTQQARAIKETRDKDSRVMIVIKDDDLLSSLLERQLCHCSKFVKHVAPDGTVYRVAYGYAGSISWRYDRDDHGYRAGNVDFSFAEPKIIPLEDHVVGSSGIDPIANPFFKDWLRDIVLPNSQEARVMKLKKVFRNARSLVLGRNITKDGALITADKSKGIVPFAGLDTKDLANAIVEARDGKDGVVEDLKKAIQIASSEESASGFGDLDAKTFKLDNDAHVYSFAQLLTPVVKFTRKDGSTFHLPIETVASGVIIDPVTKSDVDLSNIDSIEIPVLDIEEVMTHYNSGITKAYVADTDSSSDVYVDSVRETLSDWSDFDVDTGDAMTASDILDAVPYPSSMRSPELPINAGLAVQSFFLGNRSMPILSNAMRFEIQDPNVHIDSKVDSNPEPFDKYKLTFYHYSRKELGGDDLRSAADRARRAAHVKFEGMTSRRDEYLAVNSCAVIDSIDTSNDEELIHTLFAQAAARGAHIYVKSTELQKFRRLLNNPDVRSSTYTDPDSNTVYYKFSPSESAVTMATTDGKTAPSFLYGRTPNLFNVVLEGAMPRTDSGSVLTKAGREEINQIIDAKQSFSLPNGLAVCNVVSDFSSVDVDNAHFVNFNDDMNKMFGEGIEEKDRAAARKYIESMMREGSPVFTGGDVIALIDVGNNTYVPVYLEINVPCADVRDISYDGTKISFKVSAQVDGVASYKQYDTSIEAYKAVVTAIDDRYDVQPVNTSFGQFKQIKDPSVIPSRETVEAFESRSKTALFGLFRENARFDFTKMLSNDPDIVIEHGLYLNGSTRNIRATESFWEDFAANPMMATGIRLSQKQADALGAFVQNCLNHGVNPAAMLTSVTTNDVHDGLASSEWVTLMSDPNFRLDQLTTVLNTIDPKFCPADPYMFKDDPEGFLQQDEYFTDGSCHIKVNVTDNETGDNILQVGRFTYGAEYSNGMPLEHKKSVEDTRSMQEGIINISRGVKASKNSYRSIAETLLSMDGTPAAYAASHMPDFSIEAMETLAMKNSMLPSTVDPINRMSFGSPVVTRWKTRTLDYIKDVNDFYVKTPQILVYDEEVSGSLKEAEDGSASYVHYKWKKDIAQYDMTYAEYVHFLACGHLGITPNKDGSNVTISEPLFDEAHNAIVSALHNGKVPLPDAPSFDVKGAKFANNAITGDTRFAPAAVNPNYLVSFMRRTGKDLNEISEALDANNAAIDQALETAHSISKESRAKKVPAVNLVNYLLFTSGRSKDIDLVMDEHMATERDLNDLTADHVCEILMSPGDRQAALDLISASNDLVKHNSDLRKVNEDIMKTRASISPEAYDVTININRANAKTNQVMDTLVKLQQMNIMLGVNMPIGQGLDMAKAAIFENIGLDLGKKGIGPRRLAYGPGSRYFTNDFLSIMSTDNAAIRYATALRTASALGETQKRKFIAYMSQPGNTVEGWRSSIVASDSRESKILGKFDAIYDKAMDFGTGEAIARKKFTMAFLKEFEVELNNDPRYRQFIPQLESMLHSGDPVTVMNWMFNSGLSPLAEKALNRANRSTVAERDVTVYFIEKLTNASTTHRFISSTILGMPFARGSVDLTKRTLRNFGVPMSTINYLLTNKLVESEEIWKSAPMRALFKLRNANVHMTAEQFNEYVMKEREAFIIEAEQLKMFNSLIEAMMIDLYRFPIPVFAFVLASLGFVQPPDSDDDDREADKSAYGDQSYLDRSLKYDDYEEWTFFGQRIQFSWWMKDLIGPVLPWACYYKSMMDGENSNGLLFNGMADMVSSAPLVKMGTFIDAILDPDSLMDGLSDAEDWYADCPSGSPSPQQFLLASTEAALWSYGAQFITPRFVNDLLNNTEYEKAYNKVVKTNKYGDPILDANGNVQYVSTSYADAQLRKITNKNIVLGAFMDIASGGEGRYMSHEMPNKSIYDDDQMECMHLLSVYDYDADRIKSDDEIENVCAAIVDILANEDDMDKLYKQGFYIDSYTKKAVSNYIWSLYQDEVDSYNDMKASGLLNYYVAGGGDYNEGKRIVDEYNAKHYETLNYIKQTLYYDKLSSRELNQGLWSYNQINTNFATDSSGNVYATGFMDANNPMQQILPWRAPYTNNQGTSEQDYSTLSRVTGNPMMRDDKTPLRAYEGVRENDYTFEKFDEIGKNAGSASKTTTATTSYGGRSGGGGGGGSSRAYTKTPSHGRVTTSASRVQGPNQANTRKTTSAHTVNFNKANLSPVNDGKRILEPSIDYLRPNYSVKGSRKARRSSDL